VNIYNCERPAYARCASYGAVQVSPKRGSAKAEAKQSPPPIKLREIASSRFRAPRNDRLSHSGVKFSATPLMQ
jgi:hypothetical protein